MRKIVKTMNKTLKIEDLHVNVIFCIFEFLDPESRWVFANISRVLKEKTKENRDNYRRGVWRKYDGDIAEDLKARHT